MQSIQGLTDIKQLMLTDTAGDHREDDEQTYQAVIARGIQRLRDQTDLNPETLPLISQLIEIQQMGMLTCESQPGEFESGDWGESEQRGYIVVLLPRTMLMDFLDEIKGQGGCVVLVEESNGGPVVTFPLGVSSMYGLQAACGNWLKPWSRGGEIISLTRQRPPGKGPWDYYTNCDISQGGKFLEALQLDIHPDHRIAVANHCVCVEVIRIPMGIPDVVHIVHSAMVNLVQARIDRREEIHLLINECRKHDQTMRLQQIRRAAPKNQPVED
jgi:hypothetical protein